MTAGVFAPTPSSRNQDAPAPADGAETLRSGRRRRPALVLNEALVAPQVHRHRPAADRTARQQRRGDPQSALRRRHSPHRRFVVIGPVVAGRGALPQSVIALRVKQPRLGEARQPELVVHVGRQYEIVLSRAAAAGPDTAPPPRRRSGWQGCAATTTPSMPPGVS